MRQLLLMNLLVGLGLVGFPAALGQYSGKPRGGWLSNGRQSVRITFNIRHSCAFYVNACTAAAYVAPINHACHCAFGRGIVTHTEYAMTLLAGHGRMVSSLTAACSELSASAFFTYGGAKSAALSLRHMHEDSFSPGAQVATLYEPLRAWASHHRRLGTSGLNPVCSDLLVHKASHEYDFCCQGGACQGSDSSGCLQQWRI